MYSFKLPSGNYSFVERYKDPRTHLTKTVSVTMDKDNVRTRKKAYAALQKRIQAAIAGDPVNYTPTALKDVVAAYMSAKKSTAKEQTVKGDISHFNALMRIFGEDTDVNIFTARYIIDTLNATGEDNTRKNGRLKELSKLLRWAAKMDIIPTAAYLEKVDKWPDAAKKRREYKYLEPEELKAILDATNVDKYYRLVKFMALTGVRVGEAIALKPDDIDIEARTIRIDETHSATIDKDSTTKTDASTRTIYIQDELLPLVKSLPPELFSDVKYYAFNKWFKEITKRTIGRELTTHAIRHTHVSLLASKLIPIEIIARRIGHADIKTTRQIYLHVTQEMLKNDAKLLNATRLIN